MTATVHLPVLFLHGFMQNHHAWDEITAHLEAAGYPTLAFDLVGHGSSSAPIGSDAYTFDALVADVIAQLDEAGISRVHVVGYSMGGRIAACLALAYPDRVESLVLESAGLGSQGDRSVAELVDRDRSMAKRLRVDGLEGFVDWWETLPLFASQTTLPCDIRRQVRTMRLDNDPEALAKTIEMTGQHAMPDVQDQLVRLGIPLLYLAGKKDKRYRHIAEGLPESENLEVRLLDTGHDIHLEDAGAFISALLDFYGGRMFPHMGKALYTGHMKGADRMNAGEWVEADSYEEILYHTREGIAKITINRPHHRNAFTPLTVDELYDAFTRAREDPSIGVILLTGANHGGDHGDEAFCSGGDQKIRGDGGYVGKDHMPRLNVLDLQRLIRTVPKPVIAMVNGYAIGGGHVLHLICDLSIAAETARFGQTGPRVGSFDAGYGAGYLAAVVGQKKAREIWFLCRQYSAAEALDMGLVNKVVPFDELEDECVAWAEEMLALSPMALRFMKASFNAATDGLAGLAQLGGDATLLYYRSEEAAEGCAAFKEKRSPDFSSFPRFP